MAVGLVLLGVVGWAAIVPAQSSRLPPRRWDPRPISRRSASARRRSGRPAWPGMLRHSGNSSSPEGRVGSRRRSTGRTRGGAVPGLSGRGRDGERVLRHREGAGVGPAHSAAVGGEANRPSAGDRRGGWLDPDWRRLVPETGRWGEGAIPNGSTVRPKELAAVRIGGCTYSSLCPAGASAESVRGARLLGGLGGAKTPGVGQTSPRKSRAFFLDTETPPRLSSGGVHAVSRLTGAARES